MQHIGETKDKTTSIIRCDLSNGGQHWSVEGEIILRGNF